MKSVSWIKDAVEEQWRGDINKGQECVISWIPLVFSLLVVVKRGIMRIIN
jgi:hypothetical protein